MSQEGVELVRTAYEAFNRRDFQAAGATLHPQAEWRPYLGVVEGDLYQGRDAILKMWSRLDESFGESLRLEPLEVIDCGEQIVAVIEGRARGSGSGAEVRQTWAQLVTLQDGLVFRVEAYPDRASALEAAGLSE
jgi:ketosteroid isomerase-like protein